MKNEANIETDGTEQITAETLTKYLAALDAPDIGDTGGAGLPGKQVRAETLRPEVPGGAAAVDADKQPWQDIPTANKAPGEKERGNRLPKDERAGNPEKELQPAKAQKAEKSSKAKKPDKIISINGGTSGVSCQNAGKAATAPAPAIPEQPLQPREAPRPQGTDQIVYLNLSELHPFKNHPFGIRDARRESIRLSHAEAHGKGVLRIGVNAQNALALTRKPRSEVDCGLCFANAAFSVGDGDGSC